MHAGNSRPLPQAPLSPPHLAVQSAAEAEEHGVAAQVVAERPPGERVVEDLRAQEAIRADGGKFSRRDRKSSRRF